MRFAAIFLAVFLCACASGPVDLAKAAPITNLPLVTLCHNNPSLPELEQEWYCDPLRAAKEPLVPVAELGVTREAYRLLWFRSFHPGIIVRAEIISPGEGVLSVTSLEHARKPDGELNWNSRLVFQQTSPLSEDDIKALRDSSAALSFWQLPHAFDTQRDFGAFSGEPTSELAVISSDGAAWLVEGIASDRYQIIGDGGFETPPQILGLKLLEIVRQKMPSLTINPVY